MQQEAGAIGSHRYNRGQVAINEATRLAYGKVLSDEKQATAIDFLSQAVVWFKVQGIEFRQVIGHIVSSCHREGLCQNLHHPEPQENRHQAHTPCKGCKAELFIHAHYKKIGLQHAVTQVARAE